jgi:hypothetical protein
MVSSIQFGQGFEVKVLIKICIEKNEKTLLNDY